MPASGVVSLYPICFYYRRVADRRLVCRRFAAMSITERRPHLLHPDQGKIVRARGDLYLFKALAAQTEGHYSLFEARTDSGGGVPLHRHQHDEEGVFVLEGRYRFQLGNEQIELSPGDFL